MFRKLLIALGIIKETPEKKVEPVVVSPPQEKTLLQEEAEQITEFRSKGQLGIAYLVAKTQLGVAEIPGEKNNPKIVEYHQSCTLQASDDETSWCSSFVNWAYIVAGFVINPMLMTKLLEQAKYEKKDIDAFKKSAEKFCSVHFYLGLDHVEKNIGTGQIVKLPTRSAMARSWLGFGKKIDKPIKGKTLVVFERGNNGYSGHVGFYEGQGISFIDVFGGNQGNEVNTSQYSKLKLLGYITEV